MDMSTTYSLNLAVSTRKDIEEQIDHWVIAMEKGPVELAKLRAQHYDTVLKETHIREIYRLATYHFPRLRSVKTLTPLTPADVEEIEKWIGRAKSTDALVDIVEALKELDKYKPTDIRKNLYALVQKIIIGGAYKGKKD